MQIILRSYSLNDFEKVQKILTTRGWKVSQGLDKMFGQFYEFS